MTTTNEIEREIRGAGFTDETKIRVRKKRGGRMGLSIKFGQGAEDQKAAGEFMREIARAHQEDEEDFHLDEKGQKVYRILLFGLTWRRDGVGTSCYRAADGPMRWSKNLGGARVGTCAREWAVGKDADNKWSATLHDEREGSPHLIASGLRTLREAKTAAEEAARRMPELR